MSYKPPANLTGYICLVTGASRGIGKGIALALGECGATVYVTARTVKSDNGQGLEDVAKEIENRGGKCIPVACDHSDDSQVRSLFNRIKQEQKGRLDVLVNNAFAAVGYILECSKNPRKGFWDLKSSESPEYVFDIHHKVGLRNSYICATLATQMMIECRKNNTLPLGVIIQISSLGSVNYLFNPAYTSGKAGSDKMIVDMGLDLAKDKQPVIAFSLWPGPVKTENFLEASKEDKSKIISLYDIYGESCELSGRVICHILGQSERKMREYNSTVISTGEYGYFNSIVDTDNKYPTSMRALQMLMYFFGFERLSKFIPKFVQIPKCFMRMRFSIY